MRTAGLYIQLIVLLTLFIRILLATNDTERTIYLCTGLIFLFMSATELKDNSK